MHLTIAALTLPIVPGQPQVIIPSGTFSAPNGSLKGQGPWMLNDAAGSALADKANSGTDIVVDYEHQTILSAQNGQPAPAAGWLVAGGFIWDSATGVIATNIRWTTDAADMIQEGEYRFLSPVFSCTPEGVPTALLSVALTNTPALTSLQELAIAANNRGCPMMDASPTVAPATPPVPVDAVLRVPPQPPILQPAAVAVLTQTPVSDLHPAQHPMIAALTNQVTMLGADNIRLREELATLQRQLTDSAKHSLITAALSTGRLMPGMEAWAQSMAIEDLSTYVSNAKPIAALTGTQTGGIAPKSAKVDTADMNEQEIAICKQLNISRERFIAQRVQEQQK